MSEPEIQASFPTVVVRRRSYCYYWAAAFAGLSAAAWLGVGPFLETSAISLYALQGLASELLGARVTSKKVSFPYRLMPSVPALVAWRRGVRFADMKKISIRRRVAGGKDIRFSLRSGGISSIALDSRTGRRDFCAAIARRAPHVSMSRK